MCGIVGVIYKKNFSAEHIRLNLDQALDEIRYRGPDGKGIYINKNIALGHVRLSIIDLTSNGNQPMLSNNDEYVITYNGEVYNFESLKKNLELDGINFKSKTDTEVILELFKAQGVSSFKNLNGMFAFSIVDQEKNKAYLVRDRFGVKPLYYFIDTDQIIFSSEIKAINTICGQQEINEKALPEWSYYGNTLKASTFHQGVKQLLPGSFIEIDTNTLDYIKQDFWTPKNISRNSNIVKEDSKSIIKKVGNLLEEAVRSQLVSDVPVGIFLSGGLDSSSITALAARNYEKKIDTFSVGFDFELGDGELPKAALVANRFNTNHHEIRISGYDIADITEKMVYHHDGPFSDAANIPLYLLGEKVKSKVKVVLQGDGGDEIFAGYRRYKTLAARPLWKPFVKSFSMFHNAFFNHNEKFYARQRYLNALKRFDEAELMALMLTVEDEENTPMKIFSCDLLERVSNIDPFESYRDCNNKFLEEELVQRMLYTDTQLILPSIFLEKVDRSTMAAGLEVRVPFLDNSLTSYVMALPSKEKIKKGHNKWLLKEAMRGILPDNIIFAPKSGFSVPYNLWLKGPLDELFNDKIEQLKNRNCSVFDWNYIQQLMQENKKGIRNNGFILWKILNLMIWLSNNEK
jgi:asparagine synthase (glutamine-hydrolysing)